MLLEENKVIIYKMFKDNNSKDLASPDELMASDFVRASKLAKNI